MSNAIAEQMLDAGLLQYGRFLVANRPVPYRILLDYLPAHPALLVQVAQMLFACLPASIDRILVDRESLPLGVTLSLNSDIPLIYSRGQGEDAAFDLVGAYNSGHKAVLVTTVLDDHEGSAPLLVRARRVGLEVQHVLALISARQPETQAGLSISAVLHVDDITQRLGQLGRIPGEHVRTTLNWLTASR